MMAKIFNSSGISKVAEVERNRGESLESFEKRKAQEEQRRKRNDALTERKKNLPGGVWNAPESTATPLGPVESWEETKKHMGPDPILDITVEEIMRQMREEVNHQPERFAIRLPEPERRKKTGSLLFNASGYESNFDEQDPEQMAWHTDQGKTQQELKDDAKDKPWLNNDDLVDEDTDNENLPRTEVCSK